MKAPKHIADYILRALANARGDDLERAQRSFGGMTDPELDKPHGESGQTRREVWRGYEKHRELHHEVMDYVRENL